MPSSVAVTLILPPLITTELPSKPSLDVTISIFPLSICNHADECIASSPVSISKVPSAIYTNPIFTSSSFFPCIASSPAFILIIPSAILMLSFPTRPCPDTSILYVPPAITKSFLHTIPCPFSVLIFKIPLPFKVISSFANMTPSTFVSPSDSNSPDVVRIFKLSFANVTNTLSAFFTYIGALSAHLIFASFNTICTFSSEASTTICPFVKLPETTNTPSPLIVAVDSSIFTKLESHSISLPPNVIFTADASS